jgi:hypothetical protein
LTQPRTSLRGFSLPNASPYMAHTQPAYASGQNSSKSLIYLVGAPGIEPGTS